MESGCTMSIIPERVRRAVKDLRDAVDFDNFNLARND